MLSLQIHWMFKSQHHMIYYKHRRTILEMFHWICSTINLLRHARMKHKVEEQKRLTAFHLRLRKSSMRQLHKVKLTMP
jgi:hypothetical protein